MIQGFGTMRIWVPKKLKSIEAIEFARKVVEQTLIEGENTAVGENFFNSLYCYFVSYHYAKENEKASVVFLNFKRLKGDDRPWF